MVCDTDHSAPKHRRKILAGRILQSLLHSAPISRPDPGSGIHEHLRREGEVNLASLGKGLSTEELSRSGGPVSVSVGDYLDVN